MSSTRVYCKNSGRPVPSGRKDGFYSNTDATEFGKATPSERMAVLQKRGTDPTFNLKLYREMQKSAAQPKMVRKQSTSMFGSSKTKLAEEERDRAERERVALSAARAKQKEDMAATKIQSVQRGRKARVETQGKLTVKQDSAAVKIQAMQRGRKARKTTEELKRNKQSKLQSG